MTDIMPRDEVQKLLDDWLSGHNGIPLVDAAPDLARSLLAAHDQNNRLRADAGAAVALVVEQAAASAETCRDVAVDDDDHAHGWRNASQAIADGIRALAPTDGLARLAERDNALAISAAALADRDRLAATNARLEAQVAALTGALADAVEIVHKAYVAATMEAVNAGPATPMQGKLDAWRVRCMNAETTARAALEAATIAAMPPEERVPADKQEDRG